MKVMPDKNKDQSDLIKILLDQAKITPEVAEKIKLKHLNSGQAIEEIIKEEKLVSDEDLTQAKAELYQIPFVNLVETATSPEALQIIPKSVAERYLLFPFAYDQVENILSVAMADPLDLESIEFAERKSGAKVKVFMAPKDQVERAIEEKYSQSLSAEVTAALKDTTPQEKTVDITKIGEVIREAPIAKIVSTILEFAVRSRASDIHIEPEEDKTRVRYRIDGILHEKLILPRKVHDALVSRIKILSLIHI